MRQRSHPCGSAPLAIPHVQTPEHVKIVPNSERRSCASRAELPRKVPTTPGGVRPRYSDCSKPRVTQLFSLYSKVAAARSPLLVLTAVRLTSRVLASSSP